MPLADHNRIGSDGCFYLSKTSLQKLQTLDLSHNLINEKGAAHLANCNLPKLLNLKLGTALARQPTTRSATTGCWSLPRRIGPPSPFSSSPATPLSPASTWTNSSSAQKSTCSGFSSTDARLYQFLLVTPNTNRLILEFTITALTRFIYYHKLHK